MTCATRRSVRRRTRLRRRAAAPRPPGGPPRGRRSAPPRSSSSSRAPPLPRPTACSGSTRGRSCRDSTLRGDSAHGCEQVRAARSDAHESNIQRPCDPIEVTTVPRRSGMASKELASRCRSRLGRRLEERQVARRADEVPSRFSAFSLMTSLTVQADLRIRPRAANLRDVVDKIVADDGERRQEFQVAARREVRQPLRARPSAPCSADRATSTSRRRSSGPCP